MGIFGALTTAISGLRAQSVSLEHISNNIANSQTTAYKRIETSFTELVAESDPTSLGAGVVIASSRSTNSVQGDVQSSPVATHMAINGDGFFVVERQVSQSDGTPVFEGIDLYTRRGDFELDRNGFLKNGAGYFLKGVPIDPVTGNPAGNAPGVIQVSNDFLPAQATTTIDYRANLSQLPKTASFDPAQPNSELLDPAAFTFDPTTSGTGTIPANEADTFLASSLAGGAITSFDNSGNPVNVQLRWAKIDNTNPPAASTTGTAVGNINDLAAGITAFNDGAAAVMTGGVVGTPGNIGGGAQARFDIQIGGVTNTFDITDAGIDDLAALEVAIDAAFGSNVASIAGGNQLVITAPNKTDAITITDVEAGAALLAGLTTGAVQNPTAAANDLFRITVNAVNYDFTIGTDVGEVNSLSGMVNAINNTGTLSGLVTATNVGGALSITSDNFVSPFTISGDVNAVAGLGLTAATYSPGSAGVDTWNLFYLSDSAAVGSNIQWTNVDQDYVFIDGVITPSLPAVTVSSLTVNGINIGDIVLNHGADGLSQFADSNGTVTVTDIDQNGFPTGQLSSISVSDEGRVQGVFTNGKTIDLAEIATATFQASGGLSKLDGGAFAATNVSGVALSGITGRIIAQALESSNSDIAEEFSKLVVTQQAYAAGTRIVSTADEMLQEALNMVR